MELEFSRKVLEYLA